MKKPLFLVFFIFCINCAFSQVKDSIKIENIQEVVIKGKKKQLEQTEKGNILNVAGTALEQKGNAAEILKFSPNVSKVGV
ncbi:hypothetical protein [Chryseobacterium sp. SC28]|uniref:hypothetical protein n=1 Tax=Chryseobacterium sp. SC28 TaxID=2268028 RepID=UPI000F648AC8|nr:hypothetical protein [Chryseobacterium sp. SC28]RRQ45319.1 hypothetical protein DTW91_11065 [Chryseobacterium sp. SC28]